MKKIYTNGVIITMSGQCAEMVVCEHGRIIGFEAFDDEKIFGMGQYQEKNLNKKGAILELAHRNSQASVPFMVSNRGYGFFWNNPAIGTAIFGAIRLSGMQRAQRNWIILSRREIHRLRLKNSILRQPEEHR